MDCHFRLPREDEPGSVVTAYVGARVRATVSTQVRSLEPSSVTKKMSSCESADLMIGLDMGHFDPIGAFQSPHSGNANECTKEAVLQ